MSSLTEQQEECVLRCALEMRLCIVGNNRHLKLLALGDKLKQDHGLDVDADTLWRFFAATFDLDGMQACYERLNQTRDKGPVKSPEPRDQVAKTDDDEDVLVESGQEDLRLHFAPPRPRPPVKASPSKPLAKVSAKASPVKTRSTPSRRTNAHLP